MATPRFVCRLASHHDRAVVRALDARSSVEGSAFRGVDSLDSALGSFDVRWPDGAMLSEEPFFVVCVDNEIVGFASLRLSATPKPLMTRIYVDPRARALGAGAALLGHVLNEARAKGHSGIDALSLPGDRETKNLFERQGMKARLIIASSEG